MVRLEDTLAHLRQREQRRQDVAAERARRFRSCLPEAVRLLTERFGAARVVLFGSLARGDLRPDSDVDLAVEGMARNRYFDALATLMALFESAVDLVMLEDAPESLVERIAVEGEELAVTEPRP